MAAWRITIQVDDRERQVFPYLPRYFNDGEAETLRLARADYAIVARRGDEERLCALVERKTLKDLAGSLKDGRIENLQGMVEVRQASSCDLWLFIEGPAFPAAGTKYGRIPYSTLESLAMDASVRDGIFVAKTKDLNDGVRTLKKLCERYARALELSEVTGGVCHARALTLTRKERKLPNDAERVAQMWAALPRLSVASGMLLVGADSVAGWAAREALGGAGAGAALADMRYPSGGKLAAAAQANIRKLLQGDPAMTRKFYAAASGVTPSAAEALAAAGWTIARLQADDGEAAKLTPEGRKTKLGRARIASLKELILYQCPKVEAVAAGDNAGQEAAEDPEDAADELQEE